MSGTDLASKRSCAERLRETNFSNLPFLCRGNWFPLVVVKNQRSTAASLVGRPGPELLEQQLGRSCGGAQSRVHHAAQRINEHGKATGNSVQGDTDTPDTQGAAAGKVAGSYPNQEGARQLRHVWVPNPWLGALHARVLFFREPHSPAPRRPDFVHHRRPSPAISSSSPSPTPFKPPRPAHSQTAFQSSRTTRHHVDLRADVSLLRPLSPSPFPLFFSSPRLPRHPWFTPPFGPTETDTATALSPSSPMASRYAFSGDQFPRRVVLISPAAWAGWQHHCPLRDPRVSKNKLENAALALLTPHRSFKLVALKLVTPGKAHLEQHCAWHPSSPEDGEPRMLTAPQTLTSRRSPSSPTSSTVRPLPLTQSFSVLLTLSTDMNSGPIVAMVWEGLDAVKTGRGKDPPVSFHTFLLPPTPSSLPSDAS